MYPPKKIDVCLSPDCDLDSHARGLCLGHYAKAYRLVVDRKQATWESLVSSGRARAMKLWPEKNE